MIKKLEFRASIAPIMSGIRTGGDGIRLTLDIPESDVQDAVALIALRNTPLRITVEVDDSLKGKVERLAETSKPKKEKAPHADYWNIMFGRGLLHDKHIREVVLGTDDATDGEFKERLHAEFGVDSMNEAGPSAFEAWAEAKGLKDWIKISQQASARVQG